MIFLSSRLFAAFVVGAVVTALGLAGCGDSGAGKGSLQGKVKIDGSSTVYRLSMGAYEKFQVENPDVLVTVAYKGTGAGFADFLQGKLDIVDASRPISEKEMEQAKKAGVEYIELPVAFDALTVAVNAQNDWADEMTVDELKKLWEPAAKGTVMKWNQIRSKWPDKEIKLYGAGHDSGTFDYFTEAVVGKKGSIRSDATATEDDNIIVQGIGGDKFALGYVGYAYYQPNKDKLRALKIDWKKDDEVPAVEPSPETVKAGRYNPLSRPLFIYVNKKSAARPEVNAFVEFYLSHAKDLAGILGYVPLTDAAYSMGKQRFDKQRIGTGFGGKMEFGLPLEDILKREPK